MSLSDLYIPRISLHISSSRTGRPIVGIYNIHIINWLTDTWMWKLGLRTRYSFSGNICFKFSAFCLCSACVGVDSRVHIRWGYSQLRHRVPYTMFFSLDSVSGKKRRCRWHWKKKLNTGMYLAKQKRFYLFDIKFVLCSWCIMESSWLRHRKRRLGPNRIEWEFSFILFIVSLTVVGRSRLIFVTSKNIFHWVYHETAR